MATKTRKNRVVKVCKGGRTEQQHMHRTNMNSLVSKYYKDSPYSSTARAHISAEPLKVFTDGNDFLNHHKRVAQAKTYFNGLPVRIRNRFHNDVMQLIDFMSNKENILDCIEMGLVDTTQYGRTPSQVLRDVQDAKKLFKAANTIEDATEKANTIKAAQAIYDKYGLKQEEEPSA